MKIFKDVSWLTSPVNVDEVIDEALSGQNGWEWTDKGGYWFRWYNNTMYEVVDLDRNYNRGLCITNEEGEEK